MKSLSCSNRHCPSSKNGGAAAIIRHGFYQAARGKRRRYQCQVCGKTFCATTGTPYYRIQHRRAVFDEVASLSVEGLNKSAIARVKRITWNTVHRWLERAAACCRRLNKQKVKRVSGAELQADEIRTIVRGQGTAGVGLRRNRCLVTALAINHCRQTQLPKHPGPVSRSFQPNESRSAPSDYHGWIRIL